MQHVIIGIGLTALMVLHISVVIYLIVFVITEAKHILRESRENNREFAEQNRLHQQQYLIQVQPSKLPCSYSFSFGSLRVFLTFFRRKSA